MSEQFFFNPLWKEIRREILNKKSVLVHAPCNYGKNYFYKSLHKDKKIKASFEIATLILHDDTIPSIDYRQIFEAILEQINPVVKNDIISREIFIAKFIKLIKKKDLLLILKVNQENKANTATLINALNEILSDQVNHFYYHFSILVLDDYSLYYHELAIKMKFSKWDFFVRMPFTRFSDTGHIVAEFADNLPKGFEKRSAKIILEMTGGNDGLIIETLKFLKAWGKKVSFDKLEKLIKNHLLASDIIIELRRNVLHKPFHFKQIMTDFENKKLFFVKWQDGIIKGVN